MKVCAKHIGNIVNSNLCTGCGICEGICPADVLKVKEGKVECVDETACIDCGLCEKCCPSYGYKLNNLHKNFFGIYEANSNCEDIHKNATSGGIITQLLTNALEEKAVELVAVVSGCDNFTDGFCKYILTDKVEDVLGATGSNYVQASMGTLIKEIKKCNKKVAIVALPCQMYGITQAMKYNQALKQNIVLKISFLCGYTYSFDCIDGLCAAMGENKDDVERVVGWREDGLPGNFAVEKKDGSRRKLPFIDEHSIDVTFYAHEKCLHCKDCFGDYADIVTGDIGRKWKDKKTLVITRTENGVQWLKRLNGNISIKPLQANQWKETPLAFMEIEKRSKVSERIKRRKKNNEFVPKWSGDYNERELPLLRKIYVKKLQKKQNKLRANKNKYLNNSEKMLKEGRWIYYKGESNVFIRYAYLAERAIQMVLRKDWKAFIKSKFKKKVRLYSDEAKCINVGVIGLGQWGKQYISLLLHHKGYRVVSIYDANENVSKSIAKRFQLSVQNPNEMIQDDRIDTIFILTPNHLHYEIIKQAFENRKNVFVEKPLTNDYRSSNELYGLSREKQKFLYVGHSMKMSSGFVKLKQLIETGELGEIKQFSCVRSLHGLNESIRASWRADSKLAPLLPMIQLGIHLIDASIYLFEKLECSYVATKEICGVTESVTCVFKSGDVVGTMLTCYDTANTMEYVVYGSKGKAILTDSELMLFTDNKRVKIQKKLYKENLLEKELNDYYGWRILGIKPMNIPERAIESVKVFDKICELAMNKEMTC